MGTNLLPVPWARLTYNTKFEAMSSTSTMIAETRASFRADKDFDWGDRTQEAELHRYMEYAYWGGF